MNLEQFAPQIVAHLHDGIVVADRQGRCLAANAAFCRLTGYTADEIIGTDLRERLAPEEVEKATEYFRRRTAGQEAPQVYETRVLHKDGKTQIDISVNAGAICIEEETGIIGVVHSITERVRAEEALRRRQRELESLLATDRDLSSVLDLDELLSLIAHRAISLLDADEFALFRLEEDGTTLRPILALGEYADEMLASPLQVGEGLTGYSVAHNQPVLANDVQDDPRAVHISGTPEEEQEHIMVAPLIFRAKTTGAMMVNRVAKQPFAEENLSLFVGFAGQAAIAIENARLHEQTRQRAVQLATLNEIGRAVSSVLDTESVLEVIYQQTQRCLPLDAFYVCLYDTETGDASFPLVYDSGRRYHETARSPGQDTSMAKVIETATPQLVNRSAEELASMVIRYPVGDPSQPSASLVFAPLQAGEHVIGALSAQSYSLNAYNQEHLTLLSGIANQVAIAVENARLHSEVQRHAEELERRVEERTGELRLALIRAQESDRAKSDFISTVNHELRTPLSNLKLYTRLLREGYAEKRDRYLDTLDREIGRLSVLVEDILTLARLDRQEPPKREQLNLVDIVRDAITRFTALADSRQIALTFTPPDHDIRIQADSGQIMRMLTNLLGNALTYTPAGGTVTLGVQARKAGSGQWAILSVKDTGPSIPLEEQRDIFARFYRGQAGRESGVPGSGLGLAIVKEIVELHHGAIRLDSAPGAGTVFYVWLPLV